MKRIVLSGLMLMSFFFGAGNLIFPPVVGHMAGNYFLEGMTGFTASAVIIPFLTLVAVTLAGDSTLSLAGRVGKVYGLVYTIIVIASIGPLFGVPRVANVSYDIGVGPLLSSLLGSKQDILSVSGLSFIVFFFVLSYFLALYGDRLVDTVGKYLSPALIIFMVLLVVVFAVTFKMPEVATISQEYAGAGCHVADPNFASQPGCHPGLSALGVGAIQGYGTLDAIAAVAFAGLVVTALRPSPSTPQHEVLKDVVKAGVIACSLLALIYFGIAYLGNVTSNSGFTQGAQILTYAAEQAFGGYGRAVFAVIVFLACITTSIGLLKTIASYAYGLFGLFSEKYWLLIFTVFSAGLSVQGLDSVIKTSVPMIYFVYPITICLVLLTLFNKVMKDRAWVYFTVALFVTPVAFADGFKILTTYFTGQGTDLLDFARDYIPLSRTDFSWVVPLIAGVVVGFFLPKKRVNTFMLEKDVHPSDLD